EYKARIKKVLKALSNLQDDDYIITAQTLIAAKHCLKYSSKCDLVVVTEPDSHEYLMTYWAPRHAIPRFFTSQLEAQRLTEIDSGLVKVTPLVSFLIVHASPPDWRDKDYPTLFTWYCKPKHRYFCLFAFLKHKMDRQTYTISELLAYRPNQASPPNSVLALADNPELVEIVRESGSEESTSCNLQSITTTMKPKDRSSTSSDEVVFKANISRQPAQELAGENIREAIRDIGREQQAILDPTRPMEWKYRGRSDSEAAVPEPIPAPVGLSAQKNEGFQRFYKAVVSPTHVRVTAGGRIVPNTRGPPSPTTKRTTDSPGFEGQGLGDKSIPAKASLSQIGVGQPIPMMPQFLPGYPPGFQPMQTPVSFMPMAIGPQMPPGFSLPQQASNPAQAMPTFPTDGTLKDMHNTKPGDATDDNHAPDGKQEKLKISPPEFFDYTKPYYYNGQIIYPLSAVQPAIGNSFGTHMANPMMPIPMFGPIGVPPQIPGQMMHSLPNGISNGMAMTPFGNQRHSAPAIPTAVAPSIPANASFSAPTAPPPSSIKLSEITKKQIAQFKSSLRYHEDQLLYNRHQIDEKYVEHQIQGFKEHIAKFEAMLKSQLEYEESQRRVAMSQNQDEEKSSQTASMPSQTLSIPSQTPSMLSQTPSMPSQAPSMPSQTSSMQTQASAATGQNSQADAEKSEGVTRRRVGRAPRPIQKTWGGNAMESALAPIFEPHDQPVIPTKSYMDGVREAMATLPSQRLAAQERQQQQQMTRSFIAPYSQGTAVGALGNPGRSTQSRVSSQMTTSSRASFGVPYLLGSLPRGCNPRDATDSDYMYSRPLTDAEQRARFLYWGRAPKSATRGLPKFDGKHFYPASPVKDESDSPVPETVSHRVPNARADAEKEFRQTKSDVDPFRPMTPVYNTDSKATAGHASEDGYTFARHTRTRNNSFDTQVLSTDDVGDGDNGDVRNAMGAGHRFEDSADTTSFGSFERRAERSGARLPLKNTLLKKGPTSSALSSTMAQGLLHHYTGHAAASLSPSISKNQPGCAPDGSPGKLGLETCDMSDGGGVMISHAPERFGENCPPANVVGSPEDCQKAGTSFDLQ
ncbi:hypothetical protein QBC38DRAFT_531918, partial [Podospora fimiseda]